ncbi:MAG: SPFH domain-containing protein [Gammaproteobacteria bacterium]|nr:SPFH domain-containing protein [Gammaproteobacteria bacterium]
MPTFEMLISLINNPVFWWGWVLPTVLILFVLYNTIVIVGGAQLAILERRWLGVKMPEGRVVAMSNQVGIQARTLGPGLHFLIPFIYRVTKLPLTVIDEKEVGLVESIDGEPVQTGHIFARAFDEHHLFQDGESFLKFHGEKGPQIQILPPGNYRINPYLFRVTKVPVVSIDNNKIGVIVATDGEPISEGRLLGKRIDNHESFQNGKAFLEGGGQKGPQIDILLPGTWRINTKLFNVTVTEATTIPVKEIGLVTAKDGAPLPITEYVAKSTSSHHDFQDGAAFLATGGQRGPQFDFLRPGTYYINPLLFSVSLDQVLNVARGEVGVIVSNVGKDPSLDSNVNAKNLTNTDGVERYVVASGFRGIQKDVLGPGTYYLNKLAFTPHIIPTTNITIDWAMDKWDQSTMQPVGSRVLDQAAQAKSPLLPQQGGQLSARVFDPLNIVSKDGFEMSVEVKVIFRVLPQEAPHMLARIGTIENLISDVIHPLIDSSFRNQASSSEAMQFMQDRYEEQRKAEEHVKDELAKYHVESVSVLICQIKLPDRLMQTLTNKVVAAQQKAMYDSQQEAEGRRAEMEKTKASADLQPSLVKAQIDVQIATQQKQQSITLAEGKGQSTKLEQEGIAAGIAAVGRAEGEKINAIGQATAEAYTKQAQALGAQPLSIIEIMKQVSQGNVKITPDILVGGTASGNGEGSSSANNVLAAFIASLMGQNLTLTNGKLDNKSKPS